MILDFLINVFVWFIQFVLGFIPEGPSIPDGISTTLNDVFSLFAGMNAFLPVEEMFTTITFLISSEIAVMVFHFVMWIIKVIRGHG